MKATRKADLDLSREFYRQKYLVYGGAGLVLKKKHGWGMKRFEVLVATTSMLWKLNNQLVCPGLYLLYEGNIITSVMRPADFTATYKPLGEASYEVEGVVVDAKKES